MDKKMFSFLAFFTALLMVTLACVFNVSTPNIQDAYMAFDAKGEDRTNAFGQADTFYCIVELANAPDDTLVKAVWTAVDVENIEPDYFIDEVEGKMSSGTYNFSLRPETMWPFGQYKVELYLNEELVRIMEFDVR